MEKKVVKVLPNKKGAVINVIVDPEPLGVIEVGHEQIKTTITGTLPDMVHMEFEPHDVMPGRICIKESIFPLDENDPEIGLVWNNGAVDRTPQGEIIYRKTFYTEDKKVLDELLPRAK